MQSISFEIIPLLQAWIGIIWFFLSNIHVHLGGQQFFPLLPPVRAVGFPQFDGVAGWGQGEIYWLDGEAGMGFSFPTSSIFT